MVEFDLVNIIPGNKCNLKCDHCANESGPSFNNRLSIVEIQNIVSFLNKEKVPKVVFTGGEPTLYVNEINQILTKLTYRPLISITTNGIFFLKSGTELLSKFHFLDHVQLSYDNFHGVLKPEILLGLKDYCEENNKTFNISFCIMEPSDIITVGLLQNTYDIEVIYERVTKSGRAKDKEVFYKFPLFEESVLEQICPNKSSLSYIQGQGWSHCCSNLVFNNNDKKTSDENIDKFLESDFFKLSTSKKIKEIIMDRDEQVIFSPEDSLICNACEKAFCG